MTRLKREWSLGPWGWNGQPQELWSERIFKLSTPWLTLVPSDHEPLRQRPAEATALTFQLLGVDLDTVGGDPYSISSLAHVVVSKAHNQIGDRYFHRLGDLYQAVNGNILFASFKVPDVDRVQVSSFGQFFLAPADPFSMQTDVFTQHPPVLWN
jgi:hypothetical protein